MPPCERVREESRCSAELQTRLNALLPLEKEQNEKNNELDRKDSELIELYNHLQALQNEHSTLLQEYVSAISQRAA